jgi:uncharacterized protein YfiM (DUF2279 family)
VAPVPPRRAGLRRALLVAAAALPLALLALVAAALQPQPLVERSAAVSVAEIDLARQVLLAHDPRRFPAGPRTLTLPAGAADLLLGRAAQQVLGGEARLALQSGAALVQASLPTPAWLPAVFGHWLNLQLRLQATAGLPRVSSLRLGALPLPAWLGDQLIEKHAGGLVRQVRLTPNRVQIDYDWGPATMQQLLALWFPDAERARLRAYTEQLATLTAARPAQAQLPLGALLTPMFALAAERSNGTPDAAHENRSALLTLALYATGRHAGSLLPEARRWPQPRRWRVTLGGRQDFAMHLLVSALIAAKAGDPLADAIGLYKEVLDSGSGSGFSFNDIALDRAGARLGTLAVQAPERLQAALAAGVRDSDLMPDVSDLPEFLDAREFAARYGAIGSPRYRELMQEIDLRVAAVPVLQ